MSARSRWLTLRSTRLWTQMGKCSGTQARWSAQRTHLVARRRAIGVGPGAWKYQGLFPPRPHANAKRRPL